MGADRDGAEFKITTAYDLATGAHVVTFSFGEEGGCLTPDQAAQIGVVFISAAARAKQRDEDEKPHRS